MAVLMPMEWPGIGAAEYEAARQQVNVEQLELWDHIR